MYKATTTTWGYKLFGQNSINFYHILLKEIPLTTLKMTFPQILDIYPLSDGSVNLFVKADESAEKTIKDIVAFYDKQSVDFLDTPKNYYKIPKEFRQSLMSWGLAFEGCLGILLTSENTIPVTNFEYINSHSGGLYLAPFTLLLHAEYPQIIQPSTLANYATRKTIEQTTTHLIRKIYKRMSEAQEGLEGVALLSMVEEKTSLSSQQIVALINEKSFGIKAPLHAPFFTD